jgi:hypothetical protein
VFSQLRKIRWSHRYKSLELVNEFGGTKARLCFFSAQASLKWRCVPHEWGGGLIAFVSRHTPRAGDRRVCDNL